MGSKIDTTIGKRTPPVTYEGHVRVCFYNGDDQPHYDKWLPAKNGMQARWAAISKDEYHAALQRIRGER